MATPELSTRMGTPVKAFLPVAATVAEGGQTDPGDINLSDNRNAMMKTYMVEICKGAMTKRPSLSISVNPE